MNIVILDSGYDSYDFEKSIFTEGDFNLKIHPSYKGDKAGKIDFAREAHGILVRHTVIDAEFLSEMQNLIAVVRYGVGYDNVDVAACTHYGVKAANVRGYANHAVAEHALALMLACTRGLWNPHKQLISAFASPPADDIFELHDKVLGIIGLGRIGSELAHKAAPLFGKIIACDPYKPEEHFRKTGAVRAIFAELIQQSDVISIHCNLTPETRYLLGEEAFAGMHKKPVIINTARGEIISEKALLNALVQGLVHSAGLDVFEDEPVTAAQDALVKHPRTICTGHYAWYSNRAINELQKRATLNLYHLLMGKTIDDCLNP